MLLVGGGEGSSQLVVSRQELDRRRIDAIRIAKYMDVMGAVKKGEPHPRDAMVARAHSVKEVERLTHGMLYRKLGKSDLVVSEVCLGTMTWGEQCTEEQAHAQLDMAVDEYGVNFVVRARVVWRRRTIDGGRQAPSTKPTNQPTNRPTHRTRRSCTRCPRTLTRRG